MKMQYSIIESNWQLKGAQDQKRITIKDKISLTYGMVIYLS